MATKKTKARPKPKPKKLAAKPKPKAKSKKPAAKPKPKPKPAPKPAAKPPAGPSLDEIADIYEGHGKIFENVFPRDTELIEAFLVWAKVTYPRWCDEVERIAPDSAPVTRAIRLETLIYDEENEAESIAPFFAQLPAELRSRALATLADTERDFGDGD